MKPIKRAVACLVLLLTTTLSNAALYSRTAKANVLPIGTARAPASLWQAASARRDAGHLYIVSDGIGQADVVQVPITDGIFQPGPIVRPGISVIGPLAVSSDGRYLYLQDFSQPGCARAIDVFALPDLSKYVRTFCTGLPQFYTVMSAITVDAKGYVYLAYWFLGNKPWTNGIVTFPPDASGNVSPLTSITFPGNIHAGLAVDKRGNLYVSRTPANEIIVYANPLANPVIVRRIVGPDLVVPVGLSISDDELYVACDPRGNVSPYVLAYPVRAFGNAKPDRRITPAGNYMHTSYIAEQVTVHRQQLFMTTSSAVLQLNPFIDGVQSPIAQANFLAPDPGDLAVGT